MKIFIGGYYAPDKMGARHGGRRGTGPRQSVKKGRAAFAVPPCS
jgi:hypothetical protein